MMREILAVRHAWDMLKPLESNFETTSVERHLASQFKLAAPKVEAGIPLNQTYNSSPPNHTVSPVSPDRSRSISNTLISPTSPGIPEIIGAPRTEVSHADGLLSVDGVRHTDSSEATDRMETTSISATDIVPMSTSDSRSFQDSQSRFESVLSLPLTSRTSLSSHVVPSVVPPSVRMSSKSKWKLNIGASRKPSTKSSGDSSTLSSTTLESQKLEEISLKGLMATTRNSVRGRNAKNINVTISQNSTYVLFWTQACINVWDVRTSSPILGREVLTDSSCLLAAATRVHLAYMIGTRDKLTVITSNQWHEERPKLTECPASDREPPRDVCAGC